MSYTLEFWAAPVDELAAVLADVAGQQPAEVAKRAVALMEKLGRPVDSVSHSSSGGEWFREEFIGGALAQIIGEEPARLLLDRPLAGTEWSGYPSLGWLTKDQLDEAVAKIDELGEDAIAEIEDEEASELMESVVDILHMAALSGQDLVTIYS